MTYRSAICRSTIELLVQTSILTNCEWWGVSNLYIIASIVKWKIGRLPAPPVVCVIKDPLYAKRHLRGKAESHAGLERQNKSLSQALLDFDIRNVEQREHSAEVTLFNYR